MRVTVLDMQPIEPALGGGRIRLLGLYHGLGFETLYVGTFDWPGEQPRELKLSPTLTERDVPLSPEHFAQDRRWKALAGGVNVIDTAFPLLARLSPQYVAAARGAIDGADVVVVSHPWIYPLIARALDRERQVLVYDAHNVESLLRWDLLGDAPFNREIAKGVVVTETTLARAADLVVACSDEDARFFGALEIDPERLYTAPNGVFSERIRPPDSATRAAARAALGLRGPVAIFLGSSYAPNIEAVRYIAAELCPRFPEVTFAACGGVGADASLFPAPPPNLMLPGLLTEDEKLRWLHAADLAVNPMFAGSGTNIKMFDFMAAGLGVLATPVGARGIADGTRAGIAVAGGERMPAALGALVAAPARLRAMGRANRAWVEADFSWERISPALGARLAAAARSKAAQPHGAAAVPESGAIARRPGPASAGGPVAIMSTWGMACGIAEYTAHLCAALEAHRVPMLVLGNDETDPGHLASGSHAAVGSATVKRLWHWDNLRWVNSHIDFDELRRTLRASGSRALNIQYHAAFYREEWVVDVARIAQELGLPVTVTLHNSSRLSPKTAAMLAGMGALMLVHKRAEAERLARAHPGAVRRIAFGMRNAPRRPQHAHDGAPTIATFGFLRPHKGLMELLEAMPILRGAFPGLRLVAKCALYPADDSRKYHEEVVRFIEESGLGDCVELDARFADLDETVDALAASDLIVLPYAASDEGASASLASAMAACRPVVVARSSIFDDVADDVYVADSNAPEVIAAAVATVLSNPDLQSDLEARIRAELERSDWMRVALDFLDSFGLARAQRSGEGVRQAD